jgi:drug/metabolite transporter (DMT)-like permease
MVLLAGVCLSSGGLIVRHMEAADGWQILFYRSIGFVAMLLTFLAVRYRGRIARPFREIGWPGVVVALTLGVGFTCYLFGLLLTTVANVSFIVSAGPFFAAVLAWLLLGERIHAVTALAIAAAIGGIGLMFLDGMDSGYLLGNLVALMAPFTFAIMVVAIRHAGDRDMVPATCLAGAVAGLIAFTMVGSFQVSTHDLLLSLLLGVGQVGLGFMLITLGARHVPAAEVALLALTETILAPIWVWIFIAEVPSSLSLAGGAVVVTAVIGQGLHGLYRERAAGRAVVAEAGHGR